MKFTEHLGAHLTPEWRSQYIRYEVSTMNRINYSIVLEFSRIWHDLRLTVLCTSHSLIRSEVRHLKLCKIIKSRLASVTSIVFGRVLNSLVVVAAGDRYRRCL